MDPVGAGHSVADGVSIIHKIDSRDSRGSRGGTYMAIIRTSYVNWAHACDTAHAYDRKHPGSRASI